jgi:hypothetical protein
MICQQNANMKVAHLLKTCGLSGFPALRMWMHSPSFHLLHSDLRHGESAIGISLPFIISIIEFF